VIARAFTGPSKLSLPEKRWVAGYVASLPPVDEVRTGMADGVDTVAALVSVRMLPHARHILYRPAARHNDQLAERLPIEWTKHGLGIIDCPQGKDQADSYRLRNREMVKTADELVAFVRNKKFYRSGEWMTINIAKKYYVKVELVLIDRAGR
jgi:hypothetical protein